MALSSGGNHLPYFNVLLILAVVKECFKLIAGQWTIALAGMNSVLNIISLVLVIMAFSNTGIWNADFFIYFIRAGILPAGAGLEAIWNIFIRVLIGLVAFGLIVDSVASLARALKHKVAAYL